MVKSIVRKVMFITLFLAGIVSLYLLFMTVTDYKPEEIEILNIENNQQSVLTLEDTLSIITYNIGYCGLDQDQDFFMDGGTGSRSNSKDNTIENLTEITSFLVDQQPSFILIQEMDIDATRSHQVNQYELLKENLIGYNASYATNYKVPWVPIPITKPHGYVESGLATFSQYDVSSAIRYQYPGKEKWPRQLALLDRCFLESRIPIEDGKELVVINSHLSAYDKGGVIRAQQLTYLKECLTDEYQNGNYIVVGGDWNHLLPGVDQAVFENNLPWPDWLKDIPDDFTPEGFNWGADPRVPTNRTNEAPYVKGENYVSIIDGFLVSPNIEIQEVEGISLEFQNSDHNPVKMTFRLDK
ncbi:endonuclease/exonuclease/phosphatase family protein [Vallitalea okinawensis]|uniref:endonuclease/exonuclease/phosphatase family protein n=1 Tax=Vallitalea okinawensis TaxID=2078660 RepID=UPI001FA82408|nr:endonuclease/exonuclease/phosphatase family protein [Vallitalea okinawensis]